VNASRNQSYIVYTVFLIIIIGLLVFAFSSNNMSQKPISINEASDELKRGNVTRVTIENDNSIKLTF
jgi:hypothetical protein